MSSNHDDPDQFYSSRVKKLDGDVLDQELSNLFSEQLSNICKTLENHGDYLYKLKPEIEALIKFYIWKHTVRAVGSTVGQSLFGLKLIDTRTSKLIGKRQSEAVLFFTVFLPYCKSRLLQYSRWRNFPGLDLLETAYKMLNLVNFLVFLNRGSYPHLWQRVFRVDAAHTSPTMNIASAQLEAMNRELLWHGFSEFLTFILPFVSLHRIRNFVTTCIRLSFASIRPTEVKERTFYDVQFCGICSNTPNNPREIGCAHVYCYYCLMSNYLADTKHGFDCPLCLFHVQGIESIKPVLYSVNLTDD